LGAHDAYEEALKLDPNYAVASKGLASVKKAIDAEAKAGMWIISTVIDNHTDKYGRWSKGGPNTGFRKHV
jgi:hypothetical protein